MTTTTRRRPSGALISVGIGLALLVAACSPPRSRNAGFNGYATDIVLGAQSRPTTAPPPPIVGASPNPNFPSFIVPPPPLVDTAVPAPSTTKPKPIVLRCPQASVDVIPPDAATTIDKPPVPGVYPYRQSGTWKSADGTTISVPAEVERTLQNVATAPTGEVTYDVVMKQVGSTTTMQYGMLRNGDANSDGIYLKRQTTVYDNSALATDDFAPNAPGLRMFPLPPGVGTLFRSTATDGVHATSMVLKGAVREKTRIDACGDLIEGWGTEATISVLKSGIEGGRTTKYVATYVVVPQLGGLIVADKIEVRTTDNSDIVVAEKPTTPPSTQPAAPAPNTPQTTLPPRSPDEVLQVTETNIEKLKPIRPAGAPAK
jgi:hypothetical protein